MDFTTLFMLCLISCVIGAVLMLLIQYYAFVKYIDAPEKTNEHKLFNETYTFPDNIKHTMNSMDHETTAPTLAFNLIFQFLFYELRNTAKVRKWFSRKLTLELDELTSKTTIGKFFDKLTICDLDLGVQFPEVKNIRVHHVDLNNDSGHIESLDLVLDLEYNGNFKISIDAIMLLGKKVFLSVKVKHISGMARLQLTRHPFTHWSLCFLGDPRIDLDIETIFQGRQMQSNVTSLISNQIRKAIRRKHTLPNYKIRYKPFFHKFDDEIDISDVEPPNGELDVKVIELSRLLLPDGIKDVFAKITLTPIPWVHARQHDNDHLIVTLDLEIRKAKHQQIGIVFKQLESCILVQTIIPNTPATKAKLLSGDVLISIQGKTVPNLNQISKIIKSLNLTVFCLRIERKIPGTIRTDQALNDNEVYEDLNECDILFSNNDDSAQMENKIIRYSSIDRPTSSDSSHSNTPTKTNSSLKEDDNNSQQRISRNLRNENKNILAESDDLSSQPIQIKKELDIFHQHSTIECSASNLIKINDLKRFILTESNATFWLNFSIFGHGITDNIELLGYINLPIANVLAECAESNLGVFVKQYQLVPPSVPHLNNHPLSSLSGFDPNRCFGDILLSFMWTGTVNATGTPTTENAKKERQSKISDEEHYQDSRLHDFVRTHFQHSTQCDFCGKKIWLKDAFQCKVCAMCCHKKCIIKCQNCTICGPIIDGAIGNASLSLGDASFVELKVTEAEKEADNMNETNSIVINRNNKHDHHRQSFSELIVQGLKRVNSAHNLAIPGMVAGQASLSLPPTPQHTSRKPSLTSQNTNPFPMILQKLDCLPENIYEVTDEQLNNLTEEFIGWESAENLMNMAKQTSRNLFYDLSPSDRVNRINALLVKVRLSLDIVTTAHSNLTNYVEGLNSSQADACIEADLMTKTKPSFVLQYHQSTNNMKADRKTLIRQSEERVQALSTIMLHLCTGLQYAQGVAKQ